MKLLIIAYLNEIINAYTCSIKMGYHEEEL
jgi:hypothetical protein